MQGGMLLARRDVCGNLDKIYNSKVEDAFGVPDGPLNQNILSNF